MDIVSYFKNCYHVEVSEPPVTNNEDYLLSPLDSEVALQMFPIDSHGHLTDLLSRLLNTDSALERNSILTMLEDTSTSAGREFASLDDDTKIQLLKPRTVQSFSELERYSKFVSDFIEKNNIKSDVPDDSSDDPSPSPESDVEPSPSEQS